MLCSGCSRRSKCECSCSRYDFLCEVVMTVLMNAVLMSCPLLPSIRILSQSCSLQYITKSHPAILSKCWSVLESNHAGGMGSTLGLLAPKPPPQLWTGTGCSIVTSIPMHKLIQKNMYVQCYTTICIDSKRVSRFIHSHQEAHVWFSPPQILRINLRFVCRWQAWLDS